MKTSTTNSHWRIAVGLGSCGVAAGAQALYELIEKRADPSRITLHKTGCAGICHREPMLELYSPSGGHWTYVHLNERGVKQILDRHIGRNQPVEKYLLEGGGRAESVRGFLSKQKKIALENCGAIDPESLEAYRASGGYRAAGQVLGGMTPGQLIETITASGLRGRGGAGFLTGLKWKYAAEAAGDRKYIVCNGDEGDPGAFMDRSVMESDPHRVIEGMIIGAFAIGASAGFVYVRAEYPLAVKRMGLAIEQARAAGLLGKNFDLEIREGAGAFVCGEETALIQSIEGARGMPRMRPPFPAQSGLWGCPTLINNVETFANIPWIITNGAAAFAALGTEKSKGTKVFSIVGKIRNSGLIEVPMGITLSEIIYEMGGGSATGRPIKAVQTGGPSGGCIPSALFETHIDYEELVRHGAIMGSGGMIVMDEDTCMVDLARYFLAFTAKECCGKCAPCRLGTAQLLEILTRITQGRGVGADLQTLTELGSTVKTTSLCGLGQTAPNPVLTTLQYFRQEYVEHIRERRCRAGVCQALMLAPCENSCPLHMNIPGYLQLLKENRLDDAFEMVLLDNPLPATTGRVCQYPCEQRCRRATVDEAVNMREVHRFIADAKLGRTPVAKIVRRLKQRQLPATGKRVAIAGAGPAGLTAAFYLALLGHHVTMFEAAAHPGGMLRYALPQYRLPKNTLDREVAVIRGLGVEFTCNTAVGHDITLEELTGAHDAVLLAFGTWEGEDLAVPGRGLAGVEPALDFLEAATRGEKHPVGRSVVVIGGGNAAIDSARTALRFGAEVTIVYRRSREEMPAIAEETAHALEEGARLITLAAPVQVLGENGKVTGLEVEKTALGKFDARGRRAPVRTGEKYVIPCDTIIETIGQRVEAGLLSKLGLRVTGAGTVEVDPWTLRTGDPKVFAAGDVVSGAANVSGAMALAKKAAQNIDRQLTGKDRFRELWPAFEYDNAPPPQGQGGPRNVAKIAACASRRHNFNEVTQTFSTRQARAETLRCLRCDIRTTEEDAA
ncbi:MAG: FAD-dependent oxidoreductase [Terriglobia bacterium]|jgi:NADH-quinone oxidoreductase subunit F